MAQEEPAGLLALAERLERIAADPARDDGDGVVRDAIRAFPFRGLEPLTDVADRLRRVRDRLRRERRPEGLRLDGLVTALIIMCEEHDAAIAPLRCGRCGRHRHSHAVVCRPMRGSERRICRACKEKRLDAGWSLLSTDPIDCWCHDCVSRASPPTYVVGPTADPMSMRVCDRCADDLRSEGWSAAVVSTRAL